MNLAAALIYWAIVALWLTVLGTIVYFYVRNPPAFGTTRLLLAVLAIDTFRNIFENTYFGFYFGSQYGVFPDSVAALLGQPALLIAPKILNLMAGAAVLGLLLWRWLPLAVHERGQAEQHVSDLEMLTAVDWLTGIYNRRHFETLARAELARAQRYMRPLSILMIDIDHFKPINDQHGHAAGDQALRWLAGFFSGALHAGDVCCRIGGDEFLLILPGTGAEDCREFLRRLRAGWRHESRIHDHAVAMSLGTATYPTDGATLEALCAVADASMYEDKRRAGARARSQTTAV